MLHLDWFEHVPGYRTPGCTGTGLIFATWSGMEQNIGGPGHYRWRPRTHPIREEAAGGCIPSR
jgi:hypothetical protein